MKTKFFLGATACLAIAFCSCANNGESRFLNLSTGENVDLVKGDNGQMMDRSTNRPVLLYVDTRSRDTFYGPNGVNVNGRLQPVDKGVYVYDDGKQKIKIDGDEYKVKDGGAKVKGDVDGSEFKYKDGDSKVKADEDVKMKGDGYTTKHDEDGDVKIETKDKKIKIDGETGKRTEKKRSVFGKVKDKVIGN